MTTELSHNEKMLILREKLQKDVNLILKECSWGTKRDEMCHSEFDVDFFFDTKVSSKHKESEKQKNYTMQTCVRVDSKLNPIRHYHFEDGDKLIKMSLFTKIAYATQNILGII